MNEIALAIRVLVALIFLTAALGKLRHRAVLRGVVANYRLLPELAVPAFAFALSPVEVAVAAGLLFAPVGWPEVLAAVLLTAFAMAMGINIARGRRHIDCGCFQSALKQTLSWVLVARNAGLVLLLSVPLIVPEGALSAAAAMEALLTGTVLFVLLQSLNVLWSVVPAWRQRHSLIAGAKK
ncbi:MAG TPA: MauE/DoxX family redox-associated membrane protein [Steroidobacteraceae bacterium]|nr:MauE/DoxX family redox-associated membrane protein [Steroidobacteraceae bacterium]